MALSRNIRYLRKKQGWGQDTLAEKLGYKSYTTIQKWESGVSEPPLKVVHELAKLFNVAINDLTNCDLEAGLSLNSKKTPTENGERKDVLDEVDIAFYGDYRELTEDDKETVRDMVRIMRERRSKQEK